MSVLNLSGDEAPECPLCMEFLELDDINFYPCTCGYQICRFCWNKLRTEGNGLCPACRQGYSENPADFKPLTSEEMAKIKAEKRQKDQAKKQKITENRKHLANVRVVQKNLVFVVGLSPRLADPEILKKPDYFGKFGKIHKVVINHSTQYAGSQIQGPSASAYVTYLRSEDALRAIQAVNNIFIDGRTLKASLGTTKYCSHFMKNQPCPKNDCMYLHELGDEQASFTKDQMQQGKHTEYEKALHEEMLNSLSHQDENEVSPSPELGGSVGEGEWSSQWGSTPRTGVPDHWGGADDWGSGHSGGGGGDQSWPDLGGNMPPYKGRFISSSSKDEQDKAKSKSCSSSDCDSSSVAADQMAAVQADQVVPSTGQPVPLHNPGLADAAWDDPVQETESPPVSDPSGVSVSGASISGDSGELERPRQETGWLDNDLKSSTFLDDDVDDLGFDPFHETQKGLADLLELENEAAQAQQHQAKINSSPSPDWRSGVGHSAVASSASGQPSTSARVKLPPPGFHNSSVAHLPTNTLGGNYNQGGYGGLSMPPVSSNAVDSLFGLGQVRQRSGPAPGFGSAHSAHAHQGAGGQTPEMLFGLGLGAGKAAGLDMNTGLGQGRLGLGGLGLGDRQSHGLGGPGGHLGQDNGFSSKDWQDGLRALLPNVNVSFGQGPSSSAGHFGLQNMQQQPSYSGHQERQTLQNNSNWGTGLSNGLGGNDWTMLDPAIVSGQLANNMEHPPLNHLGRADSPPNWITANLEQLTGDGGGAAGYPSQSNLIPAFNGLGLGGGPPGGRGGQGRLGGAGGWPGNIPPPASTATPPPGFSHHRQPLGQHYQGFAGVNKGSETHKIGEF